MAASPRHSERSLPMEPCDSEAAASGTLCRLFRVGVPVSGGSSGFIKRCFDLVMMKVQIPSPFRHWLLAAISCTGVASGASRTRRDFLRRSSLSRPWYLRLGTAASAGGNKKQCTHADTSDPQEYAHLSLSRLLLLQDHLLEAFVAALRKALRNIQRQAQFLVPRLLPRMGNSHADSDGRAHIGKW
ncbi:hypothetical protein cyc_06445 [Cyclospora cayetanensis]|uniref:Uncharacterized protein n=1 Tax=Cyclospora cayetanensis TaxID=88456 RepID=A0A1D3D661_9EIME|nr:hypothetical protein cyc_06445 [Cyclospora cayetanensis]